MNIKVMTAQHLEFLSLKGGCTSSSESRLVKIPHCCMAWLILLLFYSHGHMDHISAVPQHVAKRNLFGLKMAKYYTPPHLKDNLIAICEIYHQMNETSDALNKVDVIAACSDFQVPR